MKKQVSFIDQQSRVHPRSTGHPLQSSPERCLATTRSAEHRYFQSPKYTVPERRTGNNVKCGEIKGVTTTVLQQIDREPRVRRVHIPKSMMAAPFLKHPDLKTGQRRYLCSIAKIYSTSYMRALIDKQYLIGYHRLPEQGSRKGTVRMKGLSTYQEILHGPQCSHKLHHQWSGTWKKQSERRLTSARPSYSLTHVPEAKRGKPLLPSKEENKLRLKSGPLPKERNSSQTRLKSTKGKPDSQKDLGNPSESGENANSTKQVSMSESLSSLSIEDNEEKGISENVESISKEQQASMAKSADSIPTEDKTKESNQ